MPANPRPLAMEISFVLIVKLALILIAGFTVFGSRYYLHIDAAKMASQLFDKGF